MEELADINFLAVIEGQDYEKSLKKIVSTSFIYLQSILAWIFRQSFREQPSKQLNLFVGFYTISFYSAGSSHGYRGC